MNTNGASLARLYLFGAVCWAMATVYGVRLLEPSPLVLTLLIFAPPVSVAVWMAADTRHTRVAQVVDVGWLLYIALPLTIPWYALRTRRRRGWRLALTLYALALAGFLGFLSGATLTFVFSVVSELAA